MTNSLKSHKKNGDDHNKVNKVEVLMAKPLRSQATRDRILNEARRLFAELGYERTTIRAIAAAANINVSIVMRYYGSKEDLFAVAAHLDLRLPNLSSVPPEKRGEAIVTRFIDSREGPDASDQLTALMRAAVSHEAARQRFFDLVNNQVGPEIRTTIPDDQFEERLGLIITHLVGLGFTRYVLQHPLVVGMERDVIIRKFGAIVQSYLA
jgi:AcrR family transcriptional regulator